jgi:hypothetical protein
MVRTIEESIFLYALHENTDEVDRLLSILSRQELLQIASIANEVVKRADAILYEKDHV